MVDNHPEDKYLYEIIVETGPKDSHATTAKIFFILAGNDEETDVRFENSFTNFEKKNFTSQFQ